jgi:hypothetical protein
VSGRKNDRNRYVLENKDVWSDGGCCIDSLHVRCAAPVASERSRRRRQIASPLVQQQQQPAPAKRTKQIPALGQMLRASHHMCRCARGQNSRGVGAHWAPVPSSFLTTYSVCLKAGCSCPRRAGLSSRSTHTWYYRPLYIIRVYGLCRCSRRLDGHPSKRCLAHRKALREGAY